MLRALRTGLGFRVAMAIAVFAALCLMAPPAVMAFGHGEKTVHCLAHADAMDHGMHGGLGGLAQKHDGDHGTMPATHAPGCCGLYCLSALPLASGPLVEGPLLAQALAMPAEIVFHSRVPGRLDRPPISSLSV
jgi:hypothetical protein